MKNTSLIRFDQTHWQTLEPLFTYDDQTPIASQIQDKLARFCELFGIKQCGVILANKDTLQWQPTHFSVYSETLNNLYFEERLHAIDPLAPYIKQSHLPIAWGLNHQKLAARRSPNLKRFYSLYDDIDAHHGLGIPLHGKDFHAIFGLTDMGNEKNFITSYPKLSVISHLFAVSLVENLHVASETQTNQLTPREIECLTWVSVGKTMSEIAYILTISESTVSFHIENAKQKLDARTLVQAVGKAVSTKLICL